jgi:hypothetical protein
MSDSVPPPGADVERLLALHDPPDEIARRTRAIYEAMLRDSPRVRTGNFSFIAPPDLALLFDLYDTHFLGGGGGARLPGAATPVSFAMSPRLTRSAGVTKRFHRHAGKGAAGPAVHYEIALSTPLLFQTFQDVERTVRVNGVVCRDRLEAAQRIFEHELVHLLELVAHGRTSCAAGSFRALAWNLFAHSETGHDLITQRERAHARFDLRVGDRVTFEFDGARHAGVVNRITRRATVLVEDPQGMPFSDGKKYRKFYVPLAMLQKAAP